MWTIIGKFSHTTVDNVERKWRGKLRHGFGKTEPGDHEMVHQVLTHETCKWRRKRPSRTLLHRLGPRSGDRLSAPDPHFDFPASSPIFAGAPRWAPNRSLWNSCFWVHARWVCTLYFHARGGVFGTITVCHRAGRFSRSAESFGGEDRSAPRGTPAPQIPHSRWRRQRLLWHTFDRQRLNLARTGYWDRRWRARMI
jgi:hypothetical protein